MNNVRKQIEENRSVFSQLVWDYQISPQEFLDILDGKLVLGNFSQDWAIVRILENLNYYDAINLITLNLLTKRWFSVTKMLFKQSIKQGYEFVLRNNTLSPTR